MHCSTTFWIKDHSPGHLPEPRRSPALVWRKDKEEKRLDSGARNAVLWLSSDTLHFLLLNIPAWLTHSLAIRLLYDLARVFNLLLVFGLLAHFCLQLILLSTVQSLAVRGV